MKRKASGTLRPRVWISEIEFSDGSKIKLSQNDIVVFVGPNNGGKSASLRESAALLRSKGEKGVVLRDITIDKTGDEADLIAFVESIADKTPGTNSRTTYRGYGFDFDSFGLLSYWRNHENGLGNLSSAFANALSTEDRLKAANPPPNIRIIMDSPSHPIHVLQRNDEEERRLSDYFRQAFRADLIVHRNAGSEVPLYVGEKPVLEEGADRVSESYLRQLDKLAPLRYQGDGMRSFAGVLLYAFLSHHSIVFIDEPEAFLHPPQARLLGKMIAKDMPSERQLFLATHSEDFLKGLLDADSSNLKIIRIERAEMINEVSVLDASDVSAIWNDSLLRHSNILSGLFHSKVVICESDSDCRFYSAMLSATYEDTDSISPDILFIHCGGKHRIPTVVKSLIKLNVIVRVIADFDVLNDINPLKDIYENLGGTWPDVANDWKRVKASIDDQRPQLERADLKREIDTIFDSTNDTIMPRAKITEIQKLTKKASAWAKAKDVGKTFIPSGEEIEAYERMRDKLKAKGLHVVEVGQIESFYKKVGNHGQKWVNEVLRKNLKTDPDLQDARQFIHQVTD
jgi:hypothetical protein